MEIWMIPGVLISLGLTLLFELIFAFFFKVWGKREILIVILVNVLTNPIVVCCSYVNYVHQYVNIIFLTVFLEVWAVLTEALLYEKLSQKLKHPWCFSVGANAFSYFLGEIINYILGVL